METIHTDRAPQAIGPYSQAVMAGEWVFVSGQLGLVPDTGELEQDFPNQARRALSNVMAILAAAGCSASDVVRCTIYMTDMTRFGEFNALYADFFAPPYPAREVVQVAALPRGATIEISAIAVRSGRGVGPLHRNGRRA